MEVLDESTLSDNANKIFLSRYAFKDADGNIIEPTWSDLARRVSRVIASKYLVVDPDAKLTKLVDLETKFYDLLNKRIFLPNSPTLFNAGKRADNELLHKNIFDMTLNEYWDIHKQTTNKYNMYSACFVQGIDDDLDDIFNAVHDAAMTQKYGGGVGFNFSRLRPHNAPVGGTNGFASGPVSFMHVINKATEAVDQGGTRRGALMGILNINHPDIMSFIKSKEDNNGDNVLKYFNISVGITDSHDLLKKIEEDGNIDLTHPMSGYTGSIKARELMYEIAAHAWKTGDPGLIKLDAINRHTPYDIEIESTNPCGEEPLPDGGSCNLGSIDIAKLQFDKRLSQLEDVVETAVEFLTLVSFGNNVPLEKQKKILNDYRPIGLGIMGFAKFLLMHGIGYGTQESYEFAETLASRFAEYSYRASTHLATQKYGAYPKWANSKSLDDRTFMPFTGYVSGVHNIMFNNIPMANVTLNTMAPTGTISMLADTSSGIEPYFMLSYTKMVQNRDGTREYLKYVLPEVRDALTMLDVKDLLTGKSINGDDLLNYVEEHGKMPDIAPKALKELLATSQELSAEQHMKMQSIISQYIDSSVSKTINMPNSATVEDVLAVYMNALKDDNIKGITIYRDGSLQTQVLNSTKKEEKQQKLIIVNDKVMPRKIQPKQTFKSFTTRFDTTKSTTYVTLSVDSDNDPMELFINNGSEKAEIIGRLSSIALRSGVTLSELLKQLRKVHREYTTRLADIIEQLSFEAKGFERPRADLDFSNMTLIEDMYYVDSEGNTYCKQCHAKNSISHEDGCIACKVCGNSACAVS